MEWEDQLTVKALVWFEKVNLWQHQLYIVPSALILIPHIWQGMQLLNNDKENKTLHKVIIITF